MSYHGLTYEVANSVATITLNRPGRLNAVDTRTILELADACLQADQDDAVRAVVMTGSGRAFCAGGDLSGGDKTFDPKLIADAQRAAGVSSHDGEEHVETGAFVASRIYGSRKPFIAAINGAAVGIGLSLTLPMDIRIAVPGAKLAMNFVRRGVVPDACSSWFLPRIVGVSQAADWACTGRTFLSEEALAAGLLQRIVAPEQLLPTARAIALDIAENASPVAVALTRRAIYDLLGETDPRAAARRESLNMEIMGRSPDSAEGVRSFLDKRAPRFTMRVSDHVQTGLLAP